MKLTNFDYFLFDGAFGTYYEKKFGGDIPCEFACIDAPERVLEIHREYISAGAMGIKTNTFAANTLSLGVDFSAVREMISAGWEIACEAAEGTATEIFADIGPIPISADEEFREYYDIIDAFLSLGAENFLLETMTELDIFSAVSYIKEKKPDAFVLVSFAVGQDGYTIHGVPAAEIQKTAENSGADGYGFNCTCGPAHLLKIVSELEPTEKFLTVSPNSGYPSVIGERVVYLDNTDYFAEKILALKAVGAKFLGGCCGTTPKHIAEIKAKIQRGSEIAPITRASVKSVSEPTENRFAAKLLSGEKVIAVELDPPLNTDFSHIAEAAPYLRDMGADAVTLADSPLARPRADSMMISAKVQRECGIQAIPHLTCRDHNTIGLKSALLAGSIEGIRNILIVTGDPVPAVERSEIKGVFSANSYQLTRFVERLNNDVFTGNEFFPGGALNLNAEKFEQELSRALRKQENGTKFLMTQPIFSAQAEENLKLAREKLGIKILAGIMPIVSYKNAVFLNNEVAGIHIPEEIVEKLAEKDPDDVRKISMEFSMGIAERVLPYCDGFYLMTPLKKYRMTGELTKNIKEELL